MKINFLNWRWDMLPTPANCNGDHIRIKAVIVNVKEWQKLRKELSDER